MGKYQEEHQLSAIENSSLFFLNVQSLKAHHGQLLVLLNIFHHQPQIIDLKEIWPTDNDDLGMLKLEG